MFTSRLSRLLAGTLAVALLAGCGSAATPTAAAPTTRTVTTERGPVEVPSAPQRIVVLSGGLAGYAFALDAPVAATDTRVLGAQSAPGEFPPAWAAKAKEKGTTALPNGDTLSIEAVASAKPDLIVGGGQGITSVQAEESYDKLAAIAPTVLVPRTVAGWQDQLKLVADAIGRSDGVAALTKQYEDKVAAVKASVTVPAGAAAFVLSLPSKKPFLIPGTAALPALTKELGFAPDDVVAKAGNPKLFGSGDSFEISPELVAQAVTAPVVFVVSTGGPTAAQLAADPLYAQLPAFKAKQVYDLPALSFRPDFDGVMTTLDVLDKEF